MHRIAFTAFLSLLVVSKTTRTLCTPALTNDADIHIAVDDYSSKEKIGLDLQSLPGDSLLEFSIGSGDQGLVITSQDSYNNFTSPNPFDDDDEDYFDIWGVLPFIVMACSSVGVILRCFYKDKSAFSGARLNNKSSKKLRFY
ncbi:hypothetical protein NPIL_652611 [Nephila pilipes]|uniref:Uncharacterized protein n=1 Tax=Nephila pilipes TaxID=299642 RepID=A0A8X6MW35_NEPPI|nr:hypothetical protein NPIL_652611 [Nephila pilipes]